MEKKTYVVTIRVSKVLPYWDTKVLTRNVDLTMDECEALSQRLLRLSDCGAIWEWNICPLATINCGLMNEIVNTVAKAMNPAELDLFRHKFGNTVNP